MCLVFRDEETFTRRNPAVFHQDLASFLVFLVTSDDPENEEKI